MEKSKNLYAQPMNMNWGVGIAGEKWVPGRGGKRGRNWDNCNNINNKIYLKIYCMFVNV